MNTERGAQAHREAFELARDGSWQLAESACQRLLEEQPDRADTLCLLGVIYLRTNRAAEAIAPLRGSVALQSGQPLAHTMLGDALLGLGESSAALSCYEQALRQDARLGAALFGRANALLELRQFDAACAAYGKVLELSAGHAEAWFNRGNALLALSRPAQAAESYARAIRLRPDYATAHNNLGAALAELQQLGPALSSFEAAIVADPALADAHRNRGATLEKLGRPEESLQAFTNALAVNRDDLEALQARAKVLLSLRRWTEALECLDQLLVRSPRHAAALQLRGETLATLLRYDEAARSFAALLHIDPQASYAAGALHHAQRWCADWNYLDRSAEPENLRLAALAGRPVDHPFSFLAVSDDPQAQLQCARSFVEARIDRSASLSPPKPYGHERLRIAYVSGDLREHALSYLLAGVIEKHHPQGFETIGISLAPPEESPLGRRMQAAFGRFVDASGLTDRAAAQLMRSLEVDIAVDLAGHTSARLGIFGHRPAPVQVQYLGFPGTLGAPFIDYLLADAFVIPAAEAAHYSERIVYLPGCFQANGDLRSGHAPQPTREEVGLAPDAFVFCSFNSLYKLDPTAFAVWMRLLRRVPRSVLWLCPPSEIAAQNLRAAARGHDVDPERLVFAGRLPYQAHVARLAVADLFLDTLPFNGGATASDALWAGVPLLTCCGRSFAARMAGSLLHALGLAELATLDWAAYEAKAVELAEQPTALAALRSQLAEARASSLLFDSARFCRHLEQAYRQMWRTHARGDAAASFAVEAEAGSG